MQLPAALPRTILSAWLSVAVAAWAVAAAPSARPRDSADLAARLAQGKLGFSQLLAIERHQIRSSHVYTYHVEGFRPGGGLYVCDLGQRGLRRLVDAGGGQILDCDLAPDGQEVLFSWRKAENQGYHLYRINLDGTGLRQITEGRWHDYNGCWLPDGGIAFLSTRSARFAYCWNSPVGMLHRMERDGSGVRRLSANIVNDFTPSVMDDGRILYSRWEYVDKPAIPIQSLWTINPDGTMLQGFFGNRVLSPATFMSARQVPGTTQVLSLFTSHGGWASGGVCTIDRSQGVNAQQALRNLTPEVAIGRVDRGNGDDVRGPYENPFPVNDRYFLVSRDGTVLLRDCAGTEECRVLAKRDGMGFYSAMPIRRRPRGTIIPSGLPREEAAGEWATVFVQNIYNGLAPHVRPGEVKEICVVQELEKTVRIPIELRAFSFQFPVISCGATYASKKVWGCAPVAADGSASFRVPAGKPIYFMALDAQGRAVQRMRSFTHLMPGEVQGCVGCHEHRLSVSPAQRVALTRPAPVPLRPPEWGLRGFDYSALVQPVLDRHCTGCHSGPTPPAKVDLAADKTDFFNVSYETLARGRTGDHEVQWGNPYVNWIPTYNGLEANILQVTPKTWGSPRSKLADVVLAGCPDRQGKRRVQLDDWEVRRILAWIDLNVPYYGTSETAYPELPGCRRMYPAELDKVLCDVAARRCAGCHQGGKIPRPIWTRITNPQMNGFLLAPLARAAGGSQACGKAVFRDRSDPDYRAILKTFEPITAMLRDRPRDDMPGAKPALCVNRSCE